MTRILTALLLCLTLTTPAMAGRTIDELTLQDLSGPKIPKMFRDGMYAGVFLALASGGIGCDFMTTDIMIAGIDAAVQNHEITMDYRVYNAVLYVLARAGCRPTERREKQERPGA